MKKRLASSEQRPSGWRGVLSGIVSSASFETASFASMLLNIFLIGFQTDYMATRRVLEVPSGFIVAECLCCFLFTIEVTLQMLANHRLFLRGPGRFLNNLDLGLAICQVVEIAVTAAITGQLIDRGFNFAIVRGIRIVRLVRIVRSVRVMKAFAEVRSIALSIVLSFRPLLGTFIFLVFVMYVFAVIFTEMLLEDLVKLPPEDAKVKWFGSIMITVHTLVLSVTGGLDWGEVSVLLPHGGRFVLFPFFVAWTTLGIFNIVTGAFVASTSVQLRDDSAQLLCDITKKHLQAHSDKEKNTITKAELHLAMCSSPALKKSLALSSTDIEKLFALFDPDEDDMLDVDDIIAKLRVVVGPARRLEQEILLRNTCEQYYGSEMFDGMVSQGTETSLANMCLDAAARESSLALSDVECKTQELVSPFSL